MDFLILSAEAQGHGSPGKTSSCSETLKTIQSSDKQILQLEFSFFGKLPPFTNEPLVTELDQEQKEVDVSLSENLTNSSDLSLLAIKNWDKSSFDDDSLGIGELSSHFLTSLDDSLDNGFFEKEEEFDTYFDNEFCLLGNEPHFESDQDLTKIDGQVESHPMKKCVSTNIQPTELAAESEVANCEHLNSKNVTENSNVIEDSVSFSGESSPRELADIDEPWYEAAISENEALDREVALFINRSKMNNSLDHRNADEVSDPPSLSKDTSIDDVTELNASDGETKQDLEESLGILEQDILALVSFLRGRQHLQRKSKPFFEFNPNDLSFNEVGLPHVRTQRITKPCPKKKKGEKECIEKWQKEGYASLSAYKLAQKAKSILRRERIREIDKIFFTECRIKDPDQDVTKFDYLNCPRCEKRYKRHDGARRHFRLKHIEGGIL